jgi:hypothetical protein
MRDPSLVPGQTRQRQGRCLCPQPQRSNLNGSWKAFEWCGYHKRDHFKKSMYDRGIRGNPNMDRLIKCVYFTKRTWFACSV